MLRIVTALGSSVLLIAIIQCALISTASAQIKKGSKSPRSRVQQALGMMNATIDYGRPSVRGRKIFGHLEPYKKVWRTGANQCSTMSFDRDVTIAKKELKAGTYSFFTIPEKKHWTLIFNRNARLWGAGGYDPAMDALRIKVPKQTLKDLKESLTIEFDSFHLNGADLVVSWEHSQVRAPIFIDSDAEVHAEIDDKVRNAQGKVTAQSYFDAGMFLYEKKTDLDQAAEWIELATQKSPRSFWFVYYQAELAYHRGDTTKAKALVARALKMAESGASDFGYIAKCKLLTNKMKKSPKTKSGGGRR